MGIGDGTLDECFSDGGLDRCPWVAELQDECRSSSLDMLGYIDGVVGGCGGCRAGVDEIGGPDVVGGNDVVLKVGEVTGVFCTLARGDTNEILCLPVPGALRVVLAKREYSNGDSITTRRLGVDLGSTLAIYCPIGDICGASNRVLRLNKGLSGSSKFPQFDAIIGLFSLYSPSAGSTSELRILADASNGDGLGI